ncbi:MAG: protein-L-isoaspartate O-methyltransferase [Burkholderiaceae bacterium]
MNAPFEFERARFNMVEQQIRPWDVLDSSVLELLRLVRREDYMPAGMRELAFVDTRLPLRIDGIDSGETLLEPKTEARLLQELKLGPYDSALEIGAGSGYMAALLAHKAQHVTTVEINPALARFAAANLQHNGIHNARVELGDGSRGWIARAPYDVILISASLPLLPDELLAQLKVGGRLAAIVGDGPVMSAMLVTRVTDTQFKHVAMFETWAKPLTNAVTPTRFKF